MSPSPMASRVLAEKPKPLPPDPARHQHSAIARGPPDPRDTDKWPALGWRIDVNFTELPRPINYQEFVPAIAPMMPAQHAPFDRHTGKSSLGYLYALPDSAGEFLLSLIDGQVGAIVEHSIKTEPTNPDLDQATKGAIIAARIGQGSFRKNIKDVWSNRCAVRPCGRIC